MTEGLLIRSATQNDLPAVVALFADDVLGKGRDAPETPLPPCYTDALAAITTDPNQDFLVAVLGGAVVGCFQLSFLPGLTQRGAWRGQVESVRVASAHRGAGLGGTMMRWAVARCRERGCRLVQLTSNTDRVDAHRFYRALGFQPSHVGMKLTLG